MKILFLGVVVLAATLCSGAALHRGRLGAVLQSVSWVPPTYNATVINAFASKVLLNPYNPPQADPYDDPTFNTTWPDSVCAVWYPDNDDRSTYYLRNYTSPAAATADGAFVTHLHPCGFCSTTKDLSVYMNISDLTNPVRDCALEAFVSLDVAHACIENIGFTAPCALIWLQDAMNTRKECLDVCLKAWWDHTPNNLPPNSTTLNPCIECDEVRSGPIFKRVAGRTRRDSGLHSNINRPPDSVYQLTHYYY